MPEENTAASSGAERPNFAWAFGKLLLAATVFLLILYFFPLPQGLTEQDKFARLRVLGIISALTIGIEVVLYWGTTVKEVRILTWLGFGMGVIGFVIMAVLAHLAPATQYESVRLVIATFIFCLFTGVSGLVALAISSA